MNQKYEIKLNDEERSKLEKLISSGTGPARKITRAFILLKSDSTPTAPNWSYKQICQAFNVSQVTVSKVRQSYVERGLETTLDRKKPDRSYETRLDGDQEAHLIALACGEAPEGRERWTLRLLRERFIQLGYVEDVSHETIRTTLKKTNLSPG